MYNYKKLICHTKDMKNYIIIKGARAQKMGLKSTYLKI